eukprot:UN3739
MTCDLMTSCGSARQPSLFASRLLPASGANSALDMGAMLLWTSGFSPRRRRGRRTVMILSSCSSSPWKTCAMSFMCMFVARKP